MQPVRDLKSESIENLLNIGIITYNFQGCILSINNYAKEVLPTKRNINDRHIIYNIYPVLFDGENVKSEIEISKNDIRLIFKVCHHKLDSSNVIIMEDITHLKSIQRDNNLLHTILDAIHEGVQVSDERGVTIIYNYACEKSKEI